MSYYYVKQSKPVHKPYGFVSHKVLPTPSPFFGWHKDTPDVRDWKFVAPKAKVPSSVDLTSGMPVYNQGNLGSCTLFAVSSNHIFDQKKQKATVMTPSRLFAYYNARVLEGTVRWDSGTSIRNGIKSIAKYGVCSEKMWPYTINKYRTKPSATCFAEALKHQAITYWRLNQSLADMKACLTAGYPFVFGFDVYSGFMSNKVAKTGVASLPTKKEVLLGGHAVMAVGFSDATQRFTCLNSWSAGWGNHGFFTLPFSYLTSRLASDFWTVRVVEA